MSATFANNPYAEWYLNLLRIPGSPTQAFHKKHYGDKSYFDFQKDFEEQNANLNADDWAKLMEQAGARYCVLVTKHHDGYTLWPTDTPNPIIPGYYSKRDFVGELTEAVRARHEDGPVLLGRIRLDVQDRLSHRQPARIPEASGYA